MEFTDSYGYKPDLLWPWRRLEQADLENLLRRRAQQERASLQLLADALPALRAQAHKDPYPYIAIEHATGKQHGWIIAQHRDNAPTAKAPDTVTIAMSDEGELWRGTFDMYQRTLAVNDEYRPYSTLEMAWLHRTHESEITAPLVNEQEDEYVAATLQRPDNGLALTVDFLLHPRRSDNLLQ